MILRSLNWRTMRAVTLALATSGDPTKKSVPLCAKSTRSKTISAAASPATRSRRTTSPSLTLSCLPLASMTANIRFNKPFYEGKWYCNIRRPSRQTGLSQVKQIPLSYKVTRKYLQSPPNGLIFASVRERAAFPFELEVGSPHSHVSQGDGWLKALGTHILVELSDCNPQILSDVDQVAN